MEQRRNEIEAQPAAEPQVKRSYQRPVLVKQGKVEELTLTQTHSISCPIDV